MMENPPDVENSADNYGDTNVTEGASSSKPPAKSDGLSFISPAVSCTFALVCLIWGIVMSVLYSQQRNKEFSCVATAERDSQIRSQGTLGMAAISHINVVVNDTIDIGSAYYQEVLGFVPATNVDGPMKYTNITNNGFCVDAGFESCRVDIIFLKHEVMNLYLELFFYYEPLGGNLQIPIFQTNDAGGIRHIAVEVEDAVKTYEELYRSDHQGRFITKDKPIPLDPFPYTFFYWVDKYGVQWEFEQGRPVEYYHIAGITG